MRRSIVVRMLVAAALLAAIVTLVFLFLLRALDDQAAARRDSNGNERIFLAVGEAEETTLELENDLRGVLLTGNEDFRRAWDHDRRLFPSRIARLRSLVRDEPRQAAQAGAIDRALHSYVDEFEPLVRNIPLRASHARRAAETAHTKQHVAQIQERFDGLLKLELEESDAARAEAGASEDRGKAVAYGGLALSIALIVAFALYLARSIAVPVRRTAAAADELASGHLDAQVRVRGRDELARLARSFNAMAGSLRESRDELESQNVELEAQTAELEDQQHQLMLANDELTAKREQLEHTAAQLAEEKERVETFYGFGERLAAETEVEAVASIVLERLGDVAGAEVGVLYALNDEENGAFPLSAVRGLDPARLPPTVSPVDGLPGRAIAEQRIVTASHGETGLSLPVLGERVGLAHELHVPLRYGRRAIGVITLGRLGDGAFGDGELEPVVHLAEQAAVALANAFSLRHAHWLANVNRAVLDAARDGILLIASDGAVVLANQAIEQLASDVVGMSVEDAQAGRNDALAQLTTDPEAYLAAQAEIDADPDGETHDEFTLAATGRSFERYSAPVRDSDDERIGRIIVVRDISAERQADRLKSELMSTVSHELRTPLASILGFTEILLTRDPEPEARTRYLETIHTESQRLSALINDFLDLQRIEQGRFELRLEPFDFSALLRRQVELFGAQSTLHDIDLELPLQPIVLVGDEDRLAQVVGNLLSNAIKYSPEGGVVMVEAKRVKDSVFVTVTDPGLGIPVDQQAHIFEKFFRVDSSDTRPIGGTGLGLSLAHDIVALHGGRMAFDSVQGQGSRFWFELPERPAPEQQDDREPRAREDSNL